MASQLAVDLVSPLRAEFPTGGGAQLVPHCQVEPKI